MHRLRLPLGLWSNETDSTASSSWLSKLYPLDNTTDNSISVPARDSIIRRGCYKCCRRRNYRNGNGNRFCWCQNPNENETDCLSLNITATTNAAAATSSLRNTMTEKKQEFLIAFPS
jgi:hypothetical protein